jgi:hypothetical protein
MLSGFPTHFTSSSSSTNLQVYQINSWVWDLIFCFFFTASCWLFEYWFSWKWNWPKEHFWYLPFSRILSCLLIFSETIFSCSIHHRGWVCSCCSQILWIVHTMRDFGVMFERVPLMGDNTSAISIAKTQSSTKEWNTLKWDTTYWEIMWKREISRWDTLTQRASWLIFSSNPLMLLALLLYRGRGIGVCHPYFLISGGLVFYLVYFISFCFSFAFPSCSPKLTLLHLLYQFVFGWLCLSLC